MIDALTLTPPAMMRDIILFCGTLVGETVGSLIGGGSFITQPTILAVGLTIQQAIALDVSASCLTSLTGLATLGRAGRMLPWRLVLPPAIAGMFGAIIGPMIMMALSAATLAWGFGLAAVLVAFLTLHPIRTTDDRPKVLALILIGFVLGLYTGLSGAGSGIIAVALLTRFGGLSAISSVVVRKFVFIPATIVAAISYAAHGGIPWQPLIPMAIACALAGWIGTGIMLKLGDIRMAQVFRVAALVFAVLMVWKLA